MNKKLLITFAICIANFANIFSDGCCTVSSTLGNKTTSQQIITKNEDECKKIASIRRQLSGKIVTGNFNPDSSNCKTSPFDNFESRY